MSYGTENCLFCRIIKGEVKSDKVYEDDLLLVIKDIKPKAPTHLLIMPKEHIGNIADLKPTQESLAGHILVVAGELACKEKLDKKGFRLVVNNGHGGGQEILHLHVHLMG